MPKRKGIVRVGTEAVQGEDSYVVVRLLTVGEAREVLRDSRTRSMGYRKQLMDRELAEDERSMLKEEIDANVALENIEWAVRRFNDHITEWNWVDYDGSALPLPAADEAVIDLLTTEELRVLSEALSRRVETPAEASRKNLPRR